MLLCDLRALNEAEPYGDFATHGGHSEYWDGLRAVGAWKLRRLGLPLAPLWSEYEEWPRGRVVFHAPSRRFVIYLDRKLRYAAMVAAIIERFSLEGCSCDLQGDPHYVSVRSLESR